jgi:type VI protein secretion system component VasK
MNVPHSSKRKKKKKRTASGNTIDTVWGEWKPEWGRLPLIVIIGTWVVLLPTLAVAVFAVGQVLYGVVVVGLHTLGDLAVAVSVAGVGSFVIIVWGLWLFRTTRIYWMLRHEEHAEDEESKRERG